MTLLFPIIILIKFRFNEILTIFSMFINKIKNFNLNIIHKIICIFCSINYYFLTRDFF